MRDLLLSLFMSVTYITRTRNSAARKMRLYARNGDITDMGMDSAKPRGAESSPRQVTLCGTKLEQPGHICAFFDSRTEKYSALGQYFREGIEVGDRVLNVIDADVREDHLKQLANQGVPVQQAIASDQLRVLTSEETYLKGDPKNLDGMLVLLRQALETAQREGRCVRTCGEMSWIGRSQIPTDRVMEYEARVNYFVPTFDCTLLCVYDVAAMNSGLIADILATHPIAIINGGVRQNPYFVQPDEYLEMLRARKKSTSTDATGSEATA